MSNNGNEKLQSTATERQSRNGNNLTNFESLEGGCACGAVRYVSQAMPFASDYCHCETCRRLSGAPATAWMDFNTSEVSMLSEITEFQTSE